ncbi:MAG: hypothetical protein GY943_35865, partial [Chloroflexi bacterium]|nr:hypothetical protein [Chloroflexota bacterium]
MSNAPIYEICIQGHFDPRWEEWFVGMEVETAVSNQTILRGSITDQSALYGHIEKLRDLGITLIS